MTHHARSAVLVRSRRAAQVAAGFGVACLGWKLFVETQAFTNVPLTGKCSTERRARLMANRLHGYVRRTRTRLSKDSDAALYAAQRPRHSARAAARLALKMGLLERLRSWLTWFVTEAWTEANFCKLRMRRNRSIARARRRNGRCEFSPRLFSQRPVSCRSDAPRSFSAAP